jgi:hypothetical protein
VLADRLSRIRGTLGWRPFSPEVELRSPRAAPAARHPLKGAVLADRRSRIRGTLGWRPFSPEVELSSPAPRLRRVTPSRGRCWWTG